MAEAYRITLQREGEDAAQTWTMLPDPDAARTQAQELARREKGARVCVYREKHLAPNAGELIWDSRGDTGPGKL